MDRYLDFEKLYSLAKEEIGRLRTELAAARDALHNDFEPDNQSRAWHRANNALQQATRGLDPSC